VSSIQTKNQKAFFHYFKNKVGISAVSVRAMIKTNDTEPNNTKLCLAKNRSGKPCQKHPIVGRTRCRLHGGLSTGPKTPEGKARIAAAHYKHGQRSRAFVETRKRIWTELRKKEAEMKAQGYF